MGGLFLILKVIPIDWLPDSIMKSNGFLSGLLELIQNMTELMQTRFNFFTMTIKPIKSKSDYQETLRRLDILFDAKIGTQESDEADILGLLINEYEKKYYPIEAPDPIEAIKIRMEEMHLKQIDLINEIGGKSRVSEILNRRRKLTVEMIRKLTLRLNLSPALLIGDYQLTR